MASEVSDTFVIFKVSSKSEITISPKDENDIRDKNNARKIVFKRAPFLCKKKGYKRRASKSM
jgi:hypothetical protein